MVFNIFRELLGDIIWEFGMKCNAIHEMQCHPDLFFITTESGGTVEVPNKTVMNKMEARRLKFSPEKTEYC